MPRNLILIKKDGTIIIDASGYQGLTCLQDLKLILEKLKQYGIDTSILEQMLKQGESEVSEKESVEVGT